MRKRFVTNSPDMEFQARQGAVRPIDETIAALIAARKAVRLVTRGVVRLTMPGEDQAREFGGGGALISHPSMEGKEVIVAYNPLTPESIHVFDTQGRYVETVGVVAQATWFASDEESKRAFADMRRAQKQHVEQLQSIHRKTTAEELQRLEGNVAETRRAVNTLPPPDEELPRREPMSTPTSQLANRAERALQTIRAHRNRIEDEAADLAARAEAAIDGE